MDAQQTAGAPGLPSNNERSTLTYFLFISLILFMLTTRNGDDFVTRHKYQDALTSTTHQLSNYSAWLNGTDSNFTMPRMEHDLESLLQELMVEYSPSRRPGAMDVTYYSNITAFFYGHTTFHNITHSYLEKNSSDIQGQLRAKLLTEDTNMTELADSLGSWDWAVSDKISFNLLEKPHGDLQGQQDVAFVHGRLELRDSDTKEGFKLDFEGIHSIVDGAIYGFANPSGQPIDIRLLPSLVPESYKNQTSLLIVPELSARIAKLKSLIDTGVIDRDITHGDTPAAACPFVLRAQLRPTRATEQQMRELEDELQTPTGLWTIARPKLALDGVLVSKQCAILYEIRNADGVRTTLFFRRTTTYAGFATFAILLLLVLLYRQMQHSRSPSGFSRLSRWSFVMQAVVDTICFGGHVTFAIITNGRSGLSLVPPAFLVGLLFFHEAQLISMIIQMQLPEDAPPIAQVAAVQPSPPSPTPAVEGTQPSPIANTGTTPVAPPAPSIRNYWHFFWYSFRTDAQGRLWFLFFTSFTLLIRIMISPRLSHYFIGGLYSMIWLPQIWRSARRDRSSGLTSEYLLGTTAARLFFLLYFMACPVNVLEVEPKRWIYIVAAFMILQVVVILLQGYITPALFLPFQYGAAQTYDYHPLLPLPDPEAPEQSLGDCAICMEVIYGEKHDETSSGSRGLLYRVSSNENRRARGRKSYSLAPCHHLFHTTCLERWLDIKNICPQCRRLLPPL